MGTGSGEHLKIANQMGLVVVAAIEGEPGPIGALPGVQRFFDGMAEANDAAELFGSETGGVEKKPAEVAGTDTSIFG